MHKYKCIIKKCPVTTGHWGGEAKKDYTCSGNRPDFKRCQA